MTAAAPYRERYLTSQDNLRLYYRDYGDPVAPEAPVLCLGGLTRNSKDFHELAVELSRARRVLCPDYRGRGRSAYDPDWRNYQPATYLGDIRHLLAATGVHRVVVIGTSMGGLLAIGLAVLSPLAVAGVVLNDVGPELNQVAIDRIFDYVGRDNPQPDWDSAVAHLRELLPRFGLETDAEWMRFARRTYREGKDGRLHQDWDVNLGKALLAPPEPMPDLWPLYRALRHVPVAALRGERSDVLTEATFARMVETIPDVIAATVRGRGHAPTLEEPEARAVIAQMLARI